jgi:hypothetical protein
MPDKASLFCLEVFSARLDSSCIQGPEAMEEIHCQTEQKDGVRLMEQGDDDVHERKDRPHAERDLQNDRADQPQQAFLNIRG